MVRKILQKHKLQSYKRKRKPSVSLKNRKYRLQRARVLGGWPTKFWDDFSDEYRFGLKNDFKRTLRVWRMTSEAHYPENSQPSF